MKLLKIYNRSAFQNLQGFTLFELILVLSIVAIISGFGLFIGMESYSRYIFNAEKEKAVVLLNQARSRAMNNINQNAHGVCFNQQSRQYIVFEGLDCDKILGQKHSTVSSVEILWPQAIHFLPLSGRSNGGEIRFIKGNQVNIISINYEGRINW